MSTAGLPNPLPPDINRASVVNGTAIGLLIPAVVAVIARIIVRGIWIKRMGWDDWLMIIATPLLVADEVMSIVSTRYGVGRHIYYLKPSDSVMALKLNTIAQPLNILGLFFVKASIVALLIRLKLATKFLIILYSTIVLQLSITIVGVIIAFAQCRPFSKNWLVDLPGSCWPRDAFQDAAYILQGVNILTDLCYIIIPFFPIWNSFMPRLSKIVLLGTLGLGAVSMACSIAAIPFVVELGASVDVTWTIVNLAAIKIGEANVAVIVGCMPPLRPLFNKIQDQISGKKPVTSNDTYERRLVRIGLRSNEYEMLKGQGNRRLERPRPYDSTHINMAMTTPTESDALPVSRQEIAHQGRGVYV